MTEERRRSHILTDERIEEIAEKAAERAVEKIAAQVFQQVGKGVISKALWMIGAMIVGGYFWLSGNGYMK